MAEIGEGPNNTDGLVTAKAFEKFFQRPVSRMVRVAAEGYRELADLFDQVKGGLAFLLPNNIAQNSPEQANVLDQGSFAVFGCA